jgi:hypothetical protein
VIVIFSFLSDHSKLIFDIMAYYPPFSGFYAHPMDSNQAFYQDHNNNGNYKFHKPGFNNRKISQDSGISDFSSSASRKTSNIRDRFYETPFRPKSFRTNFYHSRTDKISSKKQIRFYLTAMDPINGYM